MSKLDFQNGFALGLISSGVIESGDNSRLNAFEDYIDESGVLDGKEETLNEKILKLINLAEIKKWFEESYLADDPPTGFISKQFTSVPLFDLSSKTSAYNLFSNCTKLESVPLFDTSNITTFGRCFYSCSELKSVPLLDTHNAHTFTEMFSNCTKLESVPLFDLSRGSNFSKMFQYSGIKNIPSFDLRNGGDFSYMFAYCDSLESVNLPLMGKNNFQYMFAGCDNLKTVILGDVLQGKSFSYMFENCPNLETVSELDFSNAISSTTPFKNCTSLVNVSFKSESIKDSLAIHHSPLLSNDSKQSIFDGLATVTSAKTLTLHADVKILQSQVDSANTKGWTVAGGTVVSEEEYYG
jgi:hypothetical protein